MALSEGTSVEDFGAQTLCNVATPGTVADTDFSVQSDCVTITNTENAAHASFVLAAAMATAVPVAEKTPIHLYCRLLNVKGTDDEEIPDGDNHDGHYLGTFYYSNNVAVDTLQYMSIPDAPMPNGKAAQEYEFYINNETGGAQPIKTDWDLWITSKGFTTVPAA